MKVRHPWLIKSLGWLGAGLIRFWVGTVRFQYRLLGPNVYPERPGPQGRFIYIFWHENLLGPAVWWRDSGVQVLISEHADGQLIATVCRRLGFGVVAGSSTRGGVRAVKQMLQLGRHSHLAITPDGPRGPRRQLQPGLVYLASRTGLGVVPIGVGLDRPWRLRSWDRFAIPRPWSRGTAVIGAPLRVPPDLSAAQLEPYRQSIEAELQRVSALAEEWAETGRLPVTEPAAPELRAA